MLSSISIRKIALAIFMIVSYAYYIWLRIQHSMLIHGTRRFGDTPDYFELANMPIFSSSFWIASRPPVIPLFFRLLKNNPEDIFTAHHWISIMAWGVLAFVTALAVRSFLIKSIAFIVVLGFSLGQNIIMWDPLLLSDSLAFSLLALFLASGIFLLIEWRFYKFIVLTLITILLVFVRDTYAYFVLMIGVSLLPLLVFVNIRRQVALVSGLFILLFLLNNTQATASGRWKMPFLMTVSLRILPNPEYLNYFATHGMPVTDALMERSGKPAHADGLAFLKDPRLEEFREWVDEHGRDRYIKFLWFFKADILQAPLSRLDLVFNPDLYYYTATGYRPIITNMRLSEILYPTRFGIFVVLVANIVAAALIFPAFLYRKLLWLVPLMLILFSYPQAVLVWSADANDIPRHSLYHNVELRLGLWLLVLFATDFAIILIGRSVDGRKNGA
jgi:hypothetical protein